MQICGRKTWECILKVFGTCPWYNRQLAAKTVSATVHRNWPIRRCFPWCRCSSRILFTWHFLIASCCREGNKGVATKALLKPEFVKGMIWGVSVIPSCEWKSCLDSWTLMCGIIEPLLKTKQVRREHRNSLELGRLGSGGHKKTTITRLSNFLKKCNPAVWQEHVVQKYQ